MADQPFDPFEDLDDDLEFKPAGVPSRASSAADGATGVSQRPSLRLDFKELEDQGGDIRGAAKVGEDNLQGDQFLTGIKRRDYDEALERAQHAQSGAAIAPVDELRIVHEVKAPFRLLTLGAVLFVVALVAGGFFVRWYVARSDAADLQRLEAMGHAGDAARP